MKVIIELPDTTKCAFVNYIMVDDNGEALMGVKTLDSEDVKRCAIIPETDKYTVKEK